MASAAKTYAHALETPRIIRAAIDHAMSIDTVIDAPETCIFPPMTGGDPEPPAVTTDQQADFDIAANLGADETAPYRRLVSFSGIPGSEGGERSPPDSSISRMAEAEIARHAETAMAPGR